MSCCTKRRGHVFYGGDVRASKCLRAKLITGYSCGKNAEGQCLTLNNVYVLLCEKGISRSNGGSVQITSTVNTTNDTSGQVLIRTENATQVGEIRLSGGEGEVIGGTIVVIGGNSITGNAGNANIVGGSTITGTAGFVNIRGGTGPTGQAGRILLNNAIPMGVVFPNLSTADRNAIVAPNLGMVIYNTNTSTMQVYNGGWVDI